MINAEMKQDFFEQQTQPDTTLDDELAATHNEEHYYQVLTAHGLPPPSLHFHYEQFEEKGNTVTPDPEDTSLPKNGNLKLKSANFYQIDGNGVKTLAGTFKVRAPAERQTEWEKFNALGLSSKVMFYKDSWFVNSCYLSDGDTKIEFEKQGGKCLVPGCKVKLELKDFRGIGCKGHRDHCHDCKKFIGLMCNAHNVIFSELFKLDHRSIMHIYLEHKKDCYPPPKPHPYFTKRQWAYPRKRPCYNPKTKKDSHKIGRW